MSKEPKLSAKQVVPLSPGELAGLREAAKAAGVSAGLFSRTLLLHGLDRVDELADAIAAEKSASAKRISEGATEAVNQRWDKNREEES